MNGSLGHELSRTTALLGSTGARLTVSCTSGLPFVGILASFSTTVLASETFFSKGGADGTVLNSFATPLLIMLTADSMSACVKSTALVVLANPSAIAVSAVAFVDNAFFLALSTPFAERRFSHALIFPRGQLANPAQRTRRTRRMMTITTTPTTLISASEPASTSTSVSLSVAVGCRMRALAFWLSTNAGPGPMEGLQNGTDGGQTVALVSRRMRCIVLVGILLDERAGCLRWSSWGEVGGFQADCLAWLPQNHG